MKKIITLFMIMILSAPFVSAVTYNGDGSYAVTGGDVIVSSNGLNIEILEISTQVQPHINNEFRKIEFQVEGVWFTPLVNEEERKVRAPDGRYMVISVESIDEVNPNANINIKSSSVEEKEPEEQLEEETIAEEPPKPQEKQGFFRMILSWFRKIFN